MTYTLGLDIGTTYVAAAVYRDGAVEALSLDNYRVSIPSAVFASGDDILFGVAALRRGAMQPAGLAREFKRRMGDPVPIVLDGSPYHADRLSALLTVWVVGKVSDQMGEPPTHTVVTHPANWTEFQLNLFRNALRDVDMTEVSFLSEPAAAATDFAAVSALEVGDVVLVYDLGGGTFDVALLRFTGHGFDHVIEPFGIERLGGIDFDQALFDFVLGQLPGETVAEARSSDQGRTALAQLRQAVVDAKESLSSDVAADIPVMLPEMTTSIRVTRSDFERMIQPMVRQTVDGIRITLARAEIRPPDLSAVLLVGGSSRIPLIPDLVSDELGLPVRIDAHPKLVVAKGAARQAAAEASGPGGRRRQPAGDRPAWQRWALVGAVAALLAIVGVAAATQLGGSDESGADSTTIGTTADADVGETAAEPTGAEAEAADTSADAAGGVAEVDDTTVESSIVEASTVPYAVSGEIVTSGLPLAIEVVDDELFVATLVSNELERFQLGDGLPVEQEPIVLPDENLIRVRGNDALSTADGLYVTLHERRAVALVDTVAGTAEAIELDGRPLDLTEDEDGTVWVSVVDDSDPSSLAGSLTPIVGTEVGTTVPVGSQAGSLTSSGGTVWYVHYDDDQIGRLDLATMEIETFDLEGSPSDVEVVGEELWVTLRETGEVAVLDPESMDVLHRIEVGADPHKLLVAHGSVWVTNETLPPWGVDKRPGSVSRIDPATRLAVQDPIEVGFAPIELTADSTVVYVGNHHGPVQNDMPISAYVGVGESEQRDVEQQDIDEEYTQSASVTIISPAG